MRSEGIKYAGYCKTDVYFVLKGLVAYEGLGFCGTVEEAVLGRRRDDVDVRMPAAFPARSTDEGIHKPRAS
jgi:hypothetical protein